MVLDDLLFIAEFASIYYAFIYVAYFRRFWMLIVNNSPI